MSEQEKILALAEEARAKEVKDILSTLEPQDYECARIKRHRKMSFYELEVIS